MVYEGGWIVKEVRTGNTVDIVNFTGKQNKLDALSMARDYAYRHTAKIGEPCRLVLWFVST